MSIRVMSAERERRAGSKREDVLYARCIIILLRLTLLQLGDNNERDETYRMRQF